MDVSIIIVNYNTKELTVNCINSIYEYTKNIDFEVIVVDNASSDGSKECFGAFPGIVYIYSHENLGFGKANNLGVQVSRGKYLFFLNSDTLLISNTVKILCDTYKRIPNVGCLGVRLIDGDQNYIHSSESFPLFKRQLIDLFKISKKDSYLRKELSRYTGGTIEVDYVTGADLFVDKSLFIEFGMFDGDFFMYYEDTYLNYIFKKKGRKNFIICSEKIIHLEGMSSKKMSLDKREMILTSRLVFNKKVLANSRFLVIYILLLLKEIFYITVNERNQRGLNYLKKIFFK